MAGRPGRQSGIDRSDGHDRRSRGAADQFAAGGTGASGRGLHPCTDRRGRTQPVPGLRGADRAAPRSGSDRRARSDHAHDRGVRDRLLHGVLQQPRRRSDAGVARPRTVAGDRRQARQAPHCRVHRPRRRRHGERRLAGSHARGGAWRADHLHHAQQRRLRRDGRTHDGDHRPRAAHEEHPRRPRRRGARLPDLAQQPPGAARGFRVRRTWRGQHRRQCRSYEEDVAARVRDPARGRRLLLCRDPHHVPDRLVHRDPGGARLPGAAPRVRARRRCAEGPACRAPAAAPAPASAPA